MTGKKKSDPFWKYTEEIGDKEFSCKFCQHHFRGRVSIGRFKLHLAGEPGGGTKGCDGVGEDVQTAAQQAIDASKLKKKKRPASPNNDEEACAIISHPSSSMGKGAHQSTKRPRKICEDEDKCLVERKLAKFIVLNGVPSDVIQSPSFIDFAKSLAEFGRRYEIPSPSRYSIEKCKKDVAKYVAEVKRPLAETGCTLILDQWSEVDNEDNANVNIFIYTPKGLILEAAPSGTSLQEILNSMLDNLGSRHVIQYFVKTDIEDSLFLEDPRIPACASIEIGNLLEYLVEFKWIRKTLRLARSVVKYSKKHDRVCYRISKGYYESGDLICSASSFVMLQAVLEKENELKTLHPPVASDIDDHYSSIIRCSEFWRDVKELVDVLHPIFQLLNLVNGYMSTSGYLYEAFHRAKAKIEKCLIQNQEDRYKLILEKFEECRMRTIQPMHMAAALLNPDYKFSEDLKDSEIEMGIKYMREKLVTSEDEEAFRIQLDHYREVRPSLIKRSVHPRIWWEKYAGDPLSVLGKYAIQILSQPCSIFSCNRYRLEEIFTDDNDDYKLGVNIRLMEKYGMLEAGDEEPIDLDKLSGSPEYDDNQNLGIDEEPIDFD